MDQVNKHNKNSESTYVQGSNDNANQTQEERDAQRAGKFDANAAIANGSSFPEKVKGDGDLPKKLSYVKYDSFELFYREFL
jgi:hypothetical protein